MATEAEIKERTKWEAWRLVLLEDEVQGWIDKYGADVVKSIFSRLFELYWPAFKKQMEEENVRPRED